MRAIIFAVTFLFLTAVAYAQDDPLSSGGNTGFEGDPLAGTCEAAVAPATNVGEEGAILTAACCKICRKGKACGDTCIKRSYTCTKPPGCACDGYRPEADYEGVWF